MGAFGFIGQRIGRLDIVSGRTEVTYKINLQLFAGYFAFLILFCDWNNANVYAVSSHTQFIVDDIFHGVSLFELAKVDPCVAESQVGEIVLLWSFYICLSFDIIALGRCNQERILKAIQIFFDGLCGDS